MDLTADECRERAENVNAHIQWINAGGKPEEMDKDREDEDKDPERSPMKKKKRKDKKRKEKETPLSLKTGQFSKAMTAEKQLNLGDVKKLVEEKWEEEFGKHKHNHKRVVLVCSLMCSQDGVEAKLNEFLMGCRALYKNMLKVDKSVIWELEREGGPRLFDPHGLPTDFTDCGAWVKVSGDVGVFEMRKPKKNDNNKGRHGGNDEDDLIDPEVYFQCCISCDEEPVLIWSELVSNGHELGGIR